MEYTETTWNGFRRLNFTFEGREALLVLPEKADPEGRWALKTEYFGAFPSTEIALLREGYHLAYVKNRSRWGTDDDQTCKRDFADFLHTEFGLRKRFVSVGMSCGGFHAVCFASRYPDYVSFLYLDAPLLSFFSVSADRYRHEVLEVRWPEIQRAYGFKSLSEAYAYPEQPIHRLAFLAQHALPVGLVYGGSDNVVPAFENAELLADCYRQYNAPLKTWYRSAYGHHPHGLENPAELLAYIREVAL